LPQDFLNGTVNLKIARGISITKAAHVAREQISQNAD
jgi:hypothetical protein